MGQWDQESFLNSAIAEFILLLLLTCWVSLTRKRKCLNVQTKKVSSGYLAMVRDTPQIPFTCDISSLNIERRLLGHVGVNADFQCLMAAFCFGGQKTRNLVLCLFQGLQVYSMRKNSIRLQIMQLQLQGTNLLSGGSNKFCHCKRYSSGGKGTPTSREGNIYTYSCEGKVSQIPTTVRRKVV